MYCVGVCVGTRTRHAVGHRHEFGRGFRVSAGTGGLRMDSGEFRMQSCTHCLRSCHSTLVRVVSRMSVGLVKCQHGVAIAPVCCGCLDLHTVYRGSATQRRRSTSMSCQRTPQGMLNNLHRCCATGCRTEGVGDVAAIVGMWPHMD